VESGGEGVLQARHPRRKGTVFFWGDLSGANSTGGVGAKTILLGTRRSGLFKLLKSFWWGKVRGGKKRASAQAASDNGGRR